MRGVRRGMGVLAAGFMLVAGSPAFAQTAGNPRLPPGAIVQPLDDGPGSELRRNLTTLANNPRSLDALIGAGRAAVAMGDGEAALSFFARADEVDGRNPRVKAGMGSALMLLERGSDALAMFRQAEALGAPMVEIARDRGLAYDMTGDPRRAQQDYEQVLRRRDDPEVRRRMALSLAISGQREEALAMIEGQLRGQDRAAWRTQAFILALTGDTRGASQTASRMMPGAGEQMAPFFARLTSLSPAQKARAVHFGTFPRDGRPVAAANVDTSADPGALALARNDVPVAAQPPPRPAEPLSDTAERRRPGPGATSGIRERTDLSRRADRDPALSGPIAPAVQRPVQTAEAQPRRFQPEPSPAQTQPLQIAEAGDVAPGFTLVPGGAQIGPESEPAATIPETQPQLEPQPVQTESAGLSDLASVIASLPEDEARPARPAPARATSTTSRTPARRAAPQPARRWVQLATVGDRPALAREFARLRGRAPDALRNRTAYTAPFGRSSSRLLVGPFDTGAQAQAVIAQLGRANLSAFAWTSEAGQEIERVQTSNVSRAAPSRAQPQQRPPTRGAGASSTSRRSATPARTTRGRSAPEPRPPARRRRSN